MMLPVRPGYKMTHGLVPSGARKLGTAALVDSFVWFCFIFCPPFPIKRAPGQQIPPRLHDSLFESSPLSLSSVPELSCTSRHFSRHGG